MRLLVLIILLLLKQATQPPECATCPLGTGAVPGAAAGLFSGCQPCDLGYYGAAPGVCAPCPIDTTTYFPGATRCLPCGSLLHSPTQGGQCVLCTAGACFNAHAQLCQDDDGLGAGACDNRTRLASAASANSSNGSSFAVTSDGLLHVVSGASLLETSDDAQTIFSTTSSASAATCVLRNGAPWVGDCSTAGDMDGARGSGVARLGVILDMALMEAPDATPVLFLSTATVAPANCFSIRAASLYDGALSTMLGSDALRLPVRLRTACPRYPYVIAVARGTDELVYASGGDVWHYRVLQQGANHNDDGSTPILSIGDRIIGLAARGSIDDPGMLVFATDSYVAVWTQPDVTRVATTNGLRKVQAAGRRAWWMLAGGGEIWTAGLPSVSRGCVRGYAVVANGACAQVGAGRHTTTSRSVTTCPSGTFSLAADPCAPCPPGAYYAPEGSFGCDACPAGLFAWNDQCVAACPAGAYVSNGTTCTACPSGSSASVGAQSVGECHACPAGSYVNASTGGVCAVCPPQTTSLAGSFRCVVVCAPGTCAPTGDSCLPLTQNWQIITPIQVQTSMRGVTLGAGGAVFYTDGDQIYYFLDDCGMDVGLISTCQRTGVPLLPPLLAPALVRGFTSLTLARSFAVNGSNTRTLYAASYVYHAVYGFPIVFQAGSAVLVDVDATRQLLLLQPSLLLLLASTEDRSGVAQWRSVGGPAAGFVDGPLSAARFNMPSELELSADDTRLYVSDFLNARLRVVNFASGTVATVLGAGADCWNYGSSNPSCSPPCGPGCASMSRPLGMGLAPEDDSRLYVVQNAIDSLGVLDLRSQTFAPFCALNFDNAAQFTTERCSQAAGSRTCMLYMPWDVVASSAGRVYVAVTNAITVIDTTTLACQQIAGQWWSYYDNWGFRDGSVPQMGGAPSSLLNRPTKLALDSERGILYVADYSNGALRRVFVDGQCRCTEGAIFLPAAQACYNPTPPSHPGQLVSCGPGEYALDGDTQCYPCAGASASSGVTASACLLWAAQTVSQSSAASSTTYTRVLAEPEPIGARPADWFADPLSLPPSPNWDDLFRSPNPRFEVGEARGRVPRGGEFVALRWSPLTQRWRVDTAHAPRRMLPGLWYACASGYFAIQYYSDADGAPYADVPCSTVAGAAFADPDSGGGLVRWHELRLAAAIQQGRVLVENWPLSAYADGRDSVPPAAHIQLWSRYMALGSPAAPDVAFPLLLYLQQSEPPTLPDPGASQTLSLPDPYDWPPGRQLQAVVGWPAHYACPDGFTWVGVNVSSVGDGQFESDQAALTGQIACLSCLPGSASQGSSSGDGRGGPYHCDLCPLGTFAADVASTVCRLCPSGTFANTTGASACWACPPNHYTHEGAMHAAACSPCAPGTGSCKDCVEGEYQDKSAQYECRPCPPGTFSDHANASSCTVCPSGSYQPYAREGACFGCPTYKYTPTATTCEWCTAPACPVVFAGRCGVGCGLNRYWAGIDASGNTSAGCVRCPSGTLNAFWTCALEPDVCWEPPPGLYAAPQSDGTDLIVPCPAGSGANARYDGCQPCAPGSAAPQAGGGCSPCAAGSFSSQSNATVCALCPPGAFGGGQGQTLCRGCAPGAYAGMSGASKCAPCAAGSYAPNASSASCTPCDAGTYGTVNGSTRACAANCVNDFGNAFFSAPGASACVYCVGGVVQDGGRLCLGCGRGSYETDVVVTTSNVTARVCRPCALGLAQTATAFAGNASACQPCPAPAYASLNGSVCVPSPLGFAPQLLLAPSGGSTACVACAAGTFRGVNETACTACPAGAWSPYDASSTCLRCVPGTFRGAQATCQRCPSGAYAGVFGASVCTQCPPGQQASATRTSCEPCAAGYYASTPGAVCVLCPDGLTSTAASASTGCTQCPTNTLLRGPGVCGGCDAGKYLSVDIDPLDGVNPVHASCVQCPAGTFSSSPGATSASACDAGGCLPRSLVPLANASGCGPCPPGSQSTDGRACQPCAAGLYSPDGYGGCRPCPPGFFTTLTLGASLCTPCAPGSFANASTGSLGCALCAPGAYANTSGQSACQRCALDAFADTSGSVACQPRKTACNASQFVVARIGQPDRDNTCAACTGCAPTQFAVYTLDGDWNDLQFDVSADGHTPVPAPPSACPGDTFRPGYYCLDNTWMRGHYLQAQNKAGLGAADAASGMTTFQALPCTDLAVTPALDPLLAARYSLMDYVLGPSFACYVGCRYGLNDTAVHAYTAAAGGGVTSTTEDPMRNIFLPPSAKVFANLCLACSTRPCTQFAGRYRPLVVLGGCGPSCLITPDACLEPDGVTSNDGCNTACTNLPAAHASFLTGAATTGDARGCAFACTEQGYHINDDGTDCIACDSCPPLHVPITPCYPTSRTADVCRACPAIVGGIPHAWLAASSFLGNATTPGGHCTYVCQAGYYANSDATLCLACDGLNGIACPVGTFRDVATCVQTQQPPACAACTLPNDDVGGDGAHVTFTSSGHPVDADNCSGTCNAGYHSLLSASGAYVSDSDLTTSVWGLRCRACTLVDSVPCHGACAPGHFRDRSVVSDTTPGACKPCLTHEDCPAGQYAPACGGNGSANVHCQICPALPPDASRVYVPNNAWRSSEAAQIGLIVSQGPVANACPSACAPNRVLASDRQTCVRCAPPSFCPPAAVPGQPTPCDFRYAHWNATPAPMWWLPQFTPPALRGLLPLPRTNNNIIYGRAGLCWACALGLGTLDTTGADLCELLPGFGAPMAMQEERIPIPTLGPDVVLSIQEPRVPIPSWLRQAAAAQQPQRRLLMTLPKQPPQRRLLQQSQELAAVRHGYYNDGTTPYPSICPGGSSTRTTGNTDVSACECQPGFFNASQTRVGGCAPCPADTFRSVLMLPTNNCTPCPPSETTFGLLAQTACGCRPGSYRRRVGDNASTQCQPCLKGFFCVPCYENQASCPPTHVYLVSCMPGATSPEGSSSLLNCTCPGRARLLRPGYTLQMATQTLVPANDAFYCLDVPPNAIFSSGTLRCRDGWTPVYAPTAPDQLQGCSLCGAGHFASTATPPIRCTPCPIGSYMERTDAVGACTPCGVGLTTSTTGAGKATDCTCPPGMRRDPLTQRCQGCALGQYPSPDHSACIQCPLGMTSSVAALNITDCVCDPGSFLLLPSAGVCTPCPIGTYASRAGMRAACTACGPNRVTAGVGARALSECFCAPGFTSVSGVLCRNSSLFFH